MQIIQHKAWIQIIWLYSLLINVSLIEIFGEFAFCDFLMLTPSMAMIVIDAIVKTDLLNNHISFKAVFLYF